MSFMRRRTGKLATAGLSIGIVLVLTPILCLQLSCSKARCRGCNVIIFMVDTLRADHLGYHGYSRPTSPNLDHFAGQAAVFEANYAQASRTGPSVASLLTGLHVRSHGVVNPLTQWDGKGVLADARLTLAEILRDAGYACRAIVSNPNVYPQYGFGQGFAMYQPVAVNTDADSINNLAARWIDDLEESPFFLYLHYMEPHTPYAAPPPRNRIFADPGYRGPITGEHLQVDEILQGQLVVNAADKEQLARLYDQEICSWDLEFGRILRYLASRGKLENTLIVVVSDHGEEFFDHGSVLHGYTLFEEQLHVPLVVSGPEIEPRRIARITRNIDVVPTVLELLDVPVPEQVQGRSLVPLLEGAAGADEIVLAEAQIRAVKTVKARSFLARGWKYIETEFPTDVAPQLFDLSTDAGEQNNLYEANPEMAKRITRMLREFVQDLPAVEGQSVTLDREMLEKLKKMGYVGDRDG